MTLQEFDKVKERIFPVIRLRSNAGRGTDLTKIDLAASKRPVYAPLPGDLICLYGVRNNGGYKIILKHTLPEGVTPKKIDKIAKQNLTKELNDKVKIKKTKWGAIELTAGNNFESAACMLDWIWDFMEDEFGDDIIFAIPAEDRIFYLANGNTKALKNLEKEISAIHKKGDKLLSRKIFRYVIGEGPVVMKE